MKVEIVMQYDSAYAEVGDIASGRAKQYAQRHGYQFHLSRTMSRLCPMWAKVALMRQRCVFPTDYLLWLDADALILDIDQSLESNLSGKVMDISEDSNGLCAGVFGIKANDIGRSLLDCWLFLGQVEDESEFGLPGLKDQATLMLMERKFPAVRTLISRLPQSLVANQETKIEKTPLIYHYWARNKDKASVAHWMRETLSTL